MAYQIVPLEMTLSEFQRHLPISSFSDVIFPTVV